MNTVNEHIGIGYPIIYSRLKSDSKVVKTRSFPMCNIEGGNNRIAILEKIVKPLLSGEHIVKYKGVRNVFILNYGEIATRDTLLNMKEIWNECMNLGGGRDEFYHELQPRNDVSNYRTIVYYSGDSLEFMNEQDIETCTGISGMTFEFTEVYRSTELKIVLPDVPEILPTPDYMV